jgi:Glutamine amidotransferase domain
MLVSPSATTTGRSKSSWSTTARGRPRGSQDQLAIRSASFARTLWPPTSSDPDSAASSEGASTDANGQAHRQRTAALWSPTDGPRPPPHWVSDKTDADIPPFRSPSGEWAVSFNGVIANDDRLRAELGIHDAPTQIDAWTIGAVLDALGWDEGIRRLEGSIAIVAANRSHPGRLWVACNYQPLYERGAPDQRLLEVPARLPT